MTRENMFVDAKREDWMTLELEEELRGLAVSGKVDCAKAQQFAREHGITMSKMRSFLDVLQFKVGSCQLGCF
ncbi:MAG: hypothetical protein GY868_13650 [Deltaproteobacteria bacterium]|nr:hypothetical protein [Deltaproteobacteria bacterium]